MREFVQARDWERFHSPKNLSMSLAIDAAELMEHFQWLTEQQSRTLDEPTLQAVSHELADILIYLIRIADKLDVDLITAAREKIAINEQRYPRDKVRGRVRRAEEYD